MPQGETDLINAVVADYNAGDMDCTAGVCSDPLTIFTYSQSSAVAALAEQQLAADKIPDDALRFVMLGANPSGVPDNLYPTEVYTAAPTPSTITKRCAADAARSKLRMRHTSVIVDCDRDRCIPPTFSRGWGVPGGGR